MSKTSAHRQCEEGGASYGVMRDASAYSTHYQTISRDPSTFYIPRYHVPTNDRMTQTACGRAAAEFTAHPVVDIPEHRRCKRPGCRQRWAALLESESAAHGRPA